MAALIGVDQELQPTEPNPHVWHSELPAKREEAQEGSHMATQVTTQVTTQVGEGGLRKELCQELHDDVNHL
jgi:hypothetical protein